MDERALRLAERTKGFMPRNEGLALFDAALTAADKGPLIEIGSYCGKSTIYLGTAARERSRKLFTIDHHRGSEEHQPGEEFHDEEIFDDRLGRLDTLPPLLETIREAGLQDVVVPLIGSSPPIAAGWSLPLGMVFIDGGHSEEAAQADLAGWAPHVVSGGLLVIHDVFEDPSEGGRPPFNIYRRALESGDFAEKGREGSVRVLERVGDRV